jgi:hypothetical protein
MSIHERLAGPIPARILRAEQFHEFVEELVEWRMQGTSATCPRVRTQLVATRTVAGCSSTLPRAPRPASQRLLLVERLAGIGRLRPEPADTEGPSVRARHYSHGVTRQGRPS